MRNKRVGLHRLTRLKRNAKKYRSGSHEDHKKKR